MLSTMCSVSYHLELLREPILLGLLVNFGHFSNAPQQFLSKYGCVPACDTVSKSIMDEHILVL